jgi:hypothetical protein
LILRRHSLLQLVVAGALLLAGCGRDGEPVTHLVPQPPVDAKVLESLAY